jgi:SAM-dependent methyltransferase
MAGPDRQFWEKRFAEGNMPWDRGEPSPQLLAWLDAGALRPCRILVPGCGSGYEVAELARRGFEVTGLDYAPNALDLTRAQLGGATAELVQADVLAWEPPRPFEAIYEQTCLCALYPDHWRAYADRLHRWLVPQGKLFALFVQLSRPGAAEGRIEGPPYHCDVNGMRALFPDTRWLWPKPPYPRTTHPRGLAELAVILQRES